MAVFGSELVIALGEIGSERSLSKTPNCNNLGSQRVIHCFNITWCRREIQLRKWDHSTPVGKTFMIGVFRERNLGARKADVDAPAKQIGARFYKLQKHHKLGNLEEVKVVFYK